MGLRLLSAPVLAAVVLLSGCGGSDRDPTAAAAPSPVSAGPTSASPTAPQSVDGLPVPAKTAGDLDARTVPAPPALGAGWRTYVDPGAPEEGYLGNGSWVRARGVAEVVQGVVPLGCRRLAVPPRLPVPRHALEATYRGPRGAPGVALVLDYRGSADAAAFLAGMAQIARSCPPPAGRVRRSDPLMVGVTPVSIDGRTVLDRRRESGVGASEWLWSEAVVLKGHRVGLLIMASDPAAPEPDLGRLAVRLRAAVAR